MRIAIGADHAGFALKQHLVGDARRGSATRSTISAPTATSRSTTRHLRRGRPGGRRRARRPRHRHRRQRPGRADRRQQGPGRPRRALQRSLHRPHVARAQRRQRARDGRPDRRRPAWPTRSSTLWLDTPFEGGRHQRRIDQIAATRKTLEAFTPTTYADDRLPLPPAGARSPRPTRRSRDAIRDEVQPPEHRPRADRVGELRQPGGAARRPARC